MKFVLSIDGGGIRGIIPALVLSKIEEILGADCCQVFDLIGGTSTGGIISLGLSKKNPLTAFELANIYIKLGDKIFQRSAIKDLLSLDGITDELYDSENLELILGNYFANQSFNECQTNVLITTYDIENRAPFLIKSYDDNCDSILLKEAARATTAAPTYFEPAVLKNNEGKSFKLIDGGVYCNNPALLAYTEAKKLWPNDDIFLLSLGTGELIRPIKYKQARNWGTIGWIRPLIDSILDGVSDITHYELEELLGTWNYLRLQTKLTFASDDMDNAEPENIKNLQIEAQKVISVHEGLIYALCNLIKQEKGI